MKKREKNIIKINLIILLMLLSSCKNNIYTACPDVVEYSTEFKRQLAEDLKQEKSYFVNQVILDYFNLREKIRICNE